MYIYIWKLAVCLVNTRAGTGVADLRLVVDSARPLLDPPGGRRACQGSRGGALVATRGRPVGTRGGTRRHLQQKCVFVHFRGD